MTDQNTTMSFVQFKAHVRRVNHWEGEEPRDEDENDQLFDDENETAGDWFFHEFEGSCTELLGPFPQGDAVADRLDNVRHAGTSGERRRGADKLRVNEWLFAHRDAMIRLADEAEASDIADRLRAITEIRAAKRLDEELQEEVEDLVIDHHGDDWMSHPIERYLGDAIVDVAGDSLLAQYVTWPLRGTAGEPLQPYYELWELGFTPRFTADGTLVAWPV